MALYGYEADLYGNLPYLNNGGDTLILYDPVGNVKDFVAWEGGATAGIPDGWGSAWQPMASGGSSICDLCPAVCALRGHTWRHSPRIWPQMGFLFGGVSACTGLVCGVPRLPGRSAGWGRLTARKRGLDVVAAASAGSRIGPGTG